MRTCSVVFLASGFSILFPVISVMAADQATTENRMRDALRNTMLQLRSCETEKATLQAAKAEADEVNKDLATKMESLTAKSKKAEKTLADQATELEQFKTAIKNWQTAYQQVSETAQKTEAERAKLAGQVIVLQRQVEDQERRNAALFKIGNEILTRYEHFGLGDALGAKEPFVGITRVKLENLVQDYKDKLADQKIKP